MKRIIIIILLLISITGCITIESEQPKSSSQDNNCNAYSETFLRQEAFYWSCVVGCAKYAKLMYNKLNTTTVNLNLEYCKSDCLNSKFEIE